MDNFQTDKCFARPFKEIINQPILFIFDKLTRDQFHTVLKRTEKISELNNSSFFIDGRGVYQVSFIIYKQHKKAMNTILKLEKELFPLNPYL